MILHAFVIQLGQFALSANEKLTFPEKGKFAAGFSSNSWREQAPSHNCHVELLYQRRTRRARSVFQRLALRTSVSISKGKRSR